MTPMSLAIASAMLVGALFSVWWPLHRDAAKNSERLRDADRKIQALRATRTAGPDDEQQSATLQAAIDDVLAAARILERNATRPSLYTGVAVMLIVPLVATAIYHWQISAGTRQLEGAHETVGIDAAPTIDHGTDMRAAIAKLADKLQQHPDDAEGWALLGRTYKAMQQYAQARDAFRHAVEVAPGDAGLARELVNAGTADPAMTDSVAPQACPIPGASASSDCSDEPRHDETLGTNRISVKVELNPKFKNLVTPKDTVYVFAKAADGPSTPLAIMRLTASQLPASVTLTDGMGMLPNLNLSQFPRIVLGARVSKSGRATAQRGDLQTLSAAMDATRMEPVQLMIDHRVD